MIAVRAVDADNVFDVCELTTNKNGVGTVLEEYICCNATSIAESKYYPAMHPRAIYDDETLIGFFMYKRTREQPDTATICRFMIDHAFQGRGLGRQAFACLLDYLKARGVRRAVLMIDEGNHIAKALYLSFGFAFTGTIDKGEYYYEAWL